MEMEVVVSNWFEVCCDLPDQQSTMLDSIRQSQAKSEMPRGPHFFITCHLSFVPSITSIPSPSQNEVFYVTLSLFGIGLLA